MEVKNLFWKYKKQLKKVKVKSDNQYFYFECIDPKTKKPWLNFVKLENIYLTNGRLSDQCLGWFNFGCFKKIKYVYILQHDNELHYFLEPEKLLNKSALKKFVKSSDFINRKKAFINYKLYEKCFLQLCKGVA